MVIDMTYTLGLCVSSFFCLIASLDHCIKRYPGMSYRFDIAFGNY